MSRRKKNKTVMDAFSNPAARLGFGTFDLTQATQYVPTRMTQNYQLLTTLYRENWIVQNIVSWCRTTRSGSGTRYRRPSTRSTSTSCGAWNGRHSSGTSS
ncbi:MAG: hypothetical protein IIV27_08500, partial [Clostridia bacterium]|nr:hypothetical protein [Clostridia bacterium]